MRQQMEQWIRVNAVLVVALTLCISCQPYALSARGSEAASSAPASQPQEGGPVPVRIVVDDGRYRLLRGGQPYEIKGAGIGAGDMEAFAAHGGNSFRNWRDRDSEDGLRILDRAHRLGLTVSMCIPIGRERQGFDYDDEAAVAEQFEFARSEVLKYKDHPALLTWIIGNEPDLNHTNPKVFDAINDISKMIHQLDGNHPTTTALASSPAKLAAILADRAPDLDIISVQKYADVVNVPRYIEEAGIERPYFITEWGPVGHWEAAKTSWGAPIEHNSSEKAATYLRHYQTVMAPHRDRIIGSYVFLWGQKQERTPTWYGLFLADGSETETIDVMHYIWNGTWPENRAPQVKAMLLDAKTATENVVLQAGAPYRASIIAQDPDGDRLEYRWEIMHESEADQVGGDKEQIPAVVAGAIGAAQDGSVQLVAPAEAGAYRLFAYVYDGEGHAGHANIPFLVNQAGGAR
jgi:hypothetical protein